MTYFDLGAFGNVKLAHLKKDKNKRFALKAMKKNDIIQSKHVDHIENEKKILEMISHPFIVSYLLLMPLVSFLLTRFLFLPVIDEILWFHAGR